MEYAVLGWPEEGSTLRLDHREFAYAGKFVMSNTGKAVARESDTAARGTADREDDTIVGAVAFSDDRTDPATTWLRYVTVRRDRRGEGIGAHLARFVTERVRERGAERVKIAVNNPFAYHALFKAGFGFTGEETGLAELVLSSPGDRSAAAYRAGLDRYAERDLTDAERAFLAEKRAAGPPPEESID